MKIAIATNNKKKLKEIRAVLGGFFEEMYSLADLGIDIDIEETGTTLTENALIKARTILHLTGLASLADDSGLMCDALDGALLLRHRAVSARRQRVHRGRARGRRHHR